MRWIVWTSLVLVFVSAACNDDKEAVEDPPPPAAAKMTITGIAKEVVAAPPYVYVLVTTEDGDRWIAGPQTEVSRGDQIATPEGTPFRNFESTKLNRVFEEVFFVAAIQTQDMTEVVDRAHPESVSPVPAVQPLEKAAGGKTVAEVFAGKADLAGQEVAVRGQVVKFNAKIMGKNWIHIQDGTGDAESGTGDLTLTTMDEAAVGDRVLVTGTLASEKDFGLGYHYAVILEDANVIVEAGSAH
jgi:hypothetical protein